MSRPIIAVTIGDPAGIGPEIALRAAADPEVVKRTRTVLIGSMDVIRRAMGFNSMPSLKLNIVSDPGKGLYEPGTVDIIDCGIKGLSELPVGKISGECGKASFLYIKKAAELALEGKTDAVATAPINKESLKAGGVPYIGHTEILEGLSHSKDPVTLFEVNGLRVFFLSRHIPLFEACRFVTKDNIKNAVRRSKAVLDKLGIIGGTMAVAGLNPHSGEHGLFGDEEVREIMPAVEELKNEGIAVEGPVSADSVFHLALKGRYNSVLSLYHDQGHIATKTLDFERTISVTGGLPFLRTSVDHGTAFDIAGKGIASETSMKEAIFIAAKYAPFYR
ncbi:MAG: 4-hydroxythreonine-4-phosphate dehydrogenase PdxA [Christensenellaceae bacterium]|nr:4-hydroxythreonine-4-phosphate dehydrogenase PdxA [Christensenellaceae bacterium]